MSYILQKIGAVLWVISLVLLFKEVILPCYLTLLAIGIIDLFLVSKKEKTITQWYRPFLPKKVDTILTVVVVILFIKFHGALVGLYFLQGTIHGHLNGDW